LSDGPIGPTIFDSSGFGHLKKFLFLVMAAILDKDGSDGHNFERGPPKNHFSKVWGQTKRLKMTGIIT
jgi:hypothetical protein